MSFQNNIVIAGISGRLPESSNIKEFTKNLLKGTDMITKNKPGIGKIKDLTSFDASFFEEFSSEDITDLQLRILLEVTYEAIVDAGINPTTLRGSSTGVFIGVTSTETFDCAKESRMLECYRSTLANKISFAFDFTGPSYTLESSSLLTLHQAVTAIRNRECDAAIVAGLNLIVESLDSSCLKSFIPLSKDGKCKVFDSAADGCVRAEAVVAIYLQRLKNARRVYATVINTRTNTDGYKPASLMSSDVDKMKKKLIQEIYEKANINPANVIYVEAHGTGIRLNDVQEIQLIDEMFCKNRSTPLLIGSVKSNMGHAEAASGLCSVIKVLIAMERGIIPANLHFNTPDQDILTSKKERLQVVDKNTAWKGGLVGINAFDFGGTNVHAILRSNSKSKLSQNVLKLPRLLIVSGCTLKAVHALLNEARKYKNNNEFISLLHAVHSDDTPKHKVRGYEILDYNNTRELIEIRENSAKRPIWFIFSGVGSQRLGMYHQLFAIDILQRSLSTCAETLQPYNVNLMKNIIENSIYQNVIDYFVSIVAIQIAFVDLLASIGIYPNGMIGHSIGELCCAYCDDEDFTLEKTILAAYHVGKAIHDSKSNLEPGAMAIIGMSWKRAKCMCPDDIFLACHDAEDVITISGPVESVHTFVTYLKSKGISAEIFDSHDVALHSSYAAAVVSQLRDLLKDIMPESKQKSSKWISTSVPEDEWNIYNSSDYFVNNLLLPVLFKQAVTHIPHNAIIVQIAPHCQMYSFLHKMLPRTTIINLYGKSSISPLSVLSSIGDLYTAGAQPNISKLYWPLASFPVSRGTPMIGHLIRWDHSKKWNVSRYKQTLNTFGEHIVIDISKNEYAFLKEHKINGAIIFPQIACLFYVWKIFATMHNITFDELPVIFENVWFQRIIFMSEEKPVQLSIVILKQTGAFKIYINDEVITANGYIRTYSKCIDDFPVEEKEESTPPLQEPPYLLNCKEIYKELNLRGHEYSDVFCNIKNCDDRTINGELYWPYEWIPYLNSIIQFSMLGSSRQLQYISHISQFIVNPLRHKQLITRQVPKNPHQNWMPVLPIHRYKHTIKSGGTEIKNLTTVSAPWRQKSQANLKCEQYAFVPYDSDKLTSNQRTNIFLIVLLQIVCENVTTPDIRIVEVVHKNQNEISLLAPLVLNILNDESLITIDMQVAVPSDNYTKILSTEDINLVICDAFSKPPAENVHLIIAANVLSNPKHDFYNLLDNLIAALSPDGFILLEESNEDNKNLLDISNYKNVILVATYINKLLKNKKYILLKKVEKRREVIPVFITQNDVKWLETLQNALQSCTGNQEVLLICEDEEVGLIGLVNCIRREYRNVKMRYIFNQSKVCDNPSTSSGTISCELSDFYKDQLDKGLTANVYRNGDWGSYRYLPLEPWQDEMYTNFAYVGTLMKGNLDALKWIESPLNYYTLDNVPHDKLLCTVYYAAINKIDISTVNEVESSQYPLLEELAVSDGCTLGLEFSGKDRTTGNKCMGIVKTGALATAVLADRNFLWKVPDKWTLEDAATIPIAYTIGYYALFVRGELKRDESILICNANYISYAAITIALHAGCTVFTIVDTQMQKQYIKENFPALTDEYIGIIENVSFEEFILTETQGRGVDVILNAQFEDARRLFTFQTTAQCLANGGRFLNLTNNIETMTSVTSMSAKNVFLYSVQHCLNLLYENHAVRKEVVKLVEEGINNNVVRPLPRVMFQNLELKEAFSEKTTNSYKKVLLKVKNNELLEKPEEIYAVRRIFMDPNKSYILLGDFSRFGLQLADWLINHGAKHIIFESYFDLGSYQSWCVQHWLANGINVNISNNNMSIFSNVTHMIKESQQIAPIGGIFNLVNVPCNRSILNLNKDNLKVMMSPKIDITRNLDFIPEYFYSKLDYFIVFLSVLVGQDNASQFNNGFVNSAMEILMEKRHALGKPGLAIQWGAIEDVDLPTADVVPQLIQSCFETLEYFLLRPQLYPVLSSIVISEKHKPTATTIRKSDL